MGNQRLTQTHALAQKSQSRPVMRMSRKPQEDGLENLQGLGSNRAVNKAIAQPDSQTRSHQDSQNGNLTFRGLFSEVSAIAQPQRLVIQPKLVIGQPNDKYEQEADRVAQQVVQQLNAQTLLPNSEQKIQREIMLDENKLQLKIQNKLPMGGEEEIPPELESSIHQLRGDGQLLPDSIREPMEQKLEADFSQVRIHTDAQSDQFNRLTKSEAFTTGQDIFFRFGAYAPDRGEGQKLMAHELTHVVQQNKRIQNQKDQSEKRDDRSRGKTTQSLPDFDVTSSPVSTIRETPIIQRSLLVNSNTQKQFEDYLQLYGIKSTFHSAQNQVIGQQPSYSRMTSLKYEGTETGQMREAIVKFDNLLQTIVNDTNVEAKINFGQDMGYQEEQQIKATLLMDAAGRGDSEKVYSLATVAHEIYENYVARRDEKTKQLARDYWNPVDKTSGYKSAHEAAIEEESIITEAGGLGRRIGQLRIYRRSQTNRNPVGVIILLENYVMYLATPLQKAAKGYTSDHYVQYKKSRSGKTISVEQSTLDIVERAMKSPFAYLSVKKEKRGRAEGVGDAIISDLKTGLEKKYNSEGKTRVDKAIEGADIPAEHQNKMQVLVRVYHNTGLSAILDQQQTTIDK